MSPAPPILNPAMVNPLDRPPFDRKPWLPPISAAVPSSSSHTQRTLAWLQLPHTPTASSPISPLGPPSSAPFPPPSNSTSTPPAPSMTFATGPSTFVYPSSSGSTLPFPIVPSEHPQKSHSQPHHFTPLSAPSHRFHPYHAPSGGKHVCPPGGSSRILPPIAHPHVHAHPHLQGSARPAVAWLPGPTGQPVPVAFPLPPHPQATVLPHVRCAPNQVPAPIPVLQSMIAPHGLPTPPTSAGILPPAAVLPRHPELVAHAEFITALERKRKRIVQWALDVSSASAGPPETDADLIGEGSARSRRGVRSRSGDPVFMPSEEDDAAVDAAARARRID